MELLDSGRGGPLFRWLGEALAIDLANTILVVNPGDVRDLLATQEQVGLWLARERDRLGGGRLGKEGHAGLHQLRDVVHRLLTATATVERLCSNDIAELNRISAGAPTYAELRVTGSGVAAVLEHSSEVDALSNLLGAIARSAIELLGGPDASRLQICDAPNCGMFFLPKHPKQRWCCQACGNRARVAAHYRRVRSS